MKLLSQAHGMGAAVAAVVVALAVGFSGRSKPAQLGDPATPGVPFISQPFVAERLAIINAFEPKQRDIDKMLAEVRKTHDLENAKITVASWEPRILVVDDFLSGEEADHMIASIGDANRLGGTAVVTKDGGAAVLPNTVTSKIGTFPAADPVIRTVNERITQLSFLPYSWGESRRGRQCHSAADPPHLPSWNMHARAQGAGGIG